MIPPLLAAPSCMETNDAEEGSISYDTVANTDGTIYNDGVWIALDAETQAEDDAVEPDRHHSALRPQQTYYKMLLVRFQSLRTKLLASSFPALNATTFTSHKNPDSRRAWLDTIDKDFPASKHLGQLEESDLFQALEACSASLGRSTSISREKSCWIWTLLALASDAGTLNNNLISKIRQLGLQAGRLGARLREEATNQSHVGIEAEGEHDFNVSGEGQDCSIKGDVEHESMNEMLDCESLRSECDSHKQDGEAACQKPSGPLAGEEESNVKSLDQARARLLEQLGDRLVPSGRVPQEEREAAAQVSMKTREHERPLHRPTDWNTQATIDMILTVVAECYGQRDLLENRAAW